MFIDLLRFYAATTASAMAGADRRSTTRSRSPTSPCPASSPRRPYRVDVETTGEITRGRTVVDSRGVPGPAPNADVALAIDRPRFVDLLVDAIASFG